MYPYLNYQFVFNNSKFETCKLFSKAPEWKQVMGLTESLIKTRQHFTDTGNRIAMKSELTEQVITVKPDCSEGHVRFCFALPYLLFPDGGIPE